MPFLLIASFPESILTFRGALIDALLARGITVHVAAPGLGADSPVRTALEAKGAVAHEIPLKRTGTNPGADLILLWRLSWLMRRIRPAVVLGYTIKPAIYGSLAAWMVGVPHRFTLVTGLGYAFTGDRKGVLTNLIQWLYGFALGKVHKVFFQNPDDQMLFRERGILSAGVPSIVMNGSGVDVDAFSVVSLPKTSLCFLMIGRLLGDKGVREYARAAQCVRELHPETRFQLVGWIDENPDAIAQHELDAWVAEGCIEFLGRLDDVRPVIADCSVYVLPSYREGTPRTVLEAMAMGRPVITTDAPGCRETVVDGDNGFLVPPKSVDALVAAILCFVEDATLAPRMGARSRRIAEEKYDVHKVNDIMLREMGIDAANDMKVAQHD